MKTSFRIVSLMFVFVLALSAVGPAGAENLWAVGNLVGLCAGTHIYQGPGGGFPYHTIVPENNWTVKVIDGPRYFDGQAWWDTSRFAAGDPSGGTGWVKQSEADGCLNGGGPGEGGGGGSENTDYLYSNPHNDVISAAEPIQGAPEAASDGFQWPFSSDVSAGKSATGLWFGAPDSHCTKKLHSGVDYSQAGDTNFVYAVARGKVLLVKWDNPADNRGYGLYIVLWHIDPDGKNVYSLYSHLERGTALVKMGQPVNRGDKIARQDTSGGANGISHLHFELRNISPLVDFVTSCPADSTELDKNFRDPVTFIQDYWWQKYVSPQQPSPETLKSDVSALANSLGTQTYLEQGTINQGQSTPQQSFWVEVWDSVLMIFHKIFGSATELTIYKPDGTVYGTYIVDDPHSLGIFIPDPEPGEWKYTVRGLDIPYENYPYAISAATRTEPFLNLSDSLGDIPQDITDGDRTAPVTTLILNPAIPNGNNNWYKTPVEVSFSAVDNDAGVGVAETRYELNHSHTYIKYTVPLELTIEGLNDLVFYSTDGMGNAEMPQVAQIKIDMTPPVVNVATDQTHYTRVQPFTVHYSGYDPEPGSGLASLTGLFNSQPAANEQVIDLFWLDLGQYTLSATGEDNAGWVTTESESMQLIATIESLQQTVQRLCQETYITKGGICNGLRSKLDSALAAQKRGQNKTAVNILLAFQNELRAQTGKSIKPEARSLLIMDSNFVIVSLGGK